MIIVKFIWLQEQQPQKNLSVLSVTHSNRHLISNITKEKKNECECMHA
jgi:hypothetical protein